MLDDRILMRGLECDKYSCRWFRYNTMYMSMGGAGATTVDDKVRIYIAYIAAYIDAASGMLV